jgi:PAS domain S-box-containing protein
VAQSSHAIAVGLEYLQHLGLQWSLHPTDDDVRREYDRIWSQLGRRSIEDILELPLMTDPASLATMDVLTKIAPAAFTQMEANFHALAVCWAANLSLERGNSDASCDIYVRLGFIAGDRFGDYQSGSRFGGVGYKLVERRALSRFQARTYLLFAHFLVPYTRHVRAARDLLHRGFDVANKIGDLMFVGWYRGLYLIENLLASGDPLSVVQREAEHGLAFAEKAQLVHVVHIVQTHLELVRTLRGLTRKFGSFDEEDGYARFAKDQHSAFAEWLYYMRKVQACFHAGEYASAVEAATRAQQYAASGYLQQIADLVFYSALSYAALCDSTDQAGSHFAALSAHHKRLEIWANQCSENFECRAALVGAEIARIESRDGDAMSLYELAIRSARGGGFVHYEAIAYERASGFYRARGFDELADFYLRNARDRYIRWGAEGKVRHLDQLYPQLRQEERARVNVGTIDAPVEHLDLATVIRVSQAVSSDIVLDKLLETLMRTAIEQSGAVRGLLILPRGAVPRIAAEATTRGDTVSVQLRDEPVTAAVLPESIVHYVLRTRESVIMDDGSVLPPFAADAYINQHKPFSMLCMPLVNQGNMIGLLYLENTLTFRVFAPARITVLKLLAAQAAISLENTRLYRDLAEREAKIRRLVDANIAGIFIWDIEGRILEANDAFLEIVGYNRADLVSGCIHWTDLTPSERVDLDANQRTPELNRTDNLQPLEQELYRKDGTRVPVLIGRSLFQEGGNEGVAFILDLTERKRSEVALRESEEALRRREKELRDILETIPAMTVTVLPDGTDVFIDKRFADYSGLPADKARRSGWKATAHPDDVDEHVSKWRSSLVSGEPIEIETRFRRADGEYRWFLARAAPLRDDQGNILNWYEVLTDIEDRKRAETALRDSEEALRRSEAYLAEAQQLSHAGSVAYKDTFNIYWSDETYRILGFDPLDGLPSFDAVLQRLHPDDRERFVEVARRGVREKTDYKIELRIIFPEGLTKYTELAAHPKFSEDGKLIEVVGTIIDVTERKRAEREHERLRQLESDLAHMNRLTIMGELAASLAHEIKQPIAAARNNARAALNFLDKHPPDLGETREALECIVGDADRAGNIVDRIRDQIKKAPPRKLRFDLNEAIREVTELARSTIIQNGVTVSIRIAEKEASIEGDPVQLQQVVLNLLLNAVEAMGAVEAAAREVSISTERSVTNHILVAVRDSGPGIDPEDRERVFQAFYTTKSTGAGMGLAICRSIIEAHGGRLWVDSNEPRGAAFQFTLPSAGVDEALSGPRAQSHRVNSA